MVVGIVDELVRENVVEVVDGEKKISEGQAQEQFVEDALDLSAMFIKPDAAKRRSSLQLLNK
eukprot:CAMPEP_0175122048 /NCGR_PEP_ID=MMETSP0087-20121206/1505_1 /TAXON_ID=136419 /ORGANISM="Unknown Unknown, Strain D1" /LENGTH=61 /DNA_ID=CAMNT_0016403653 /DNA_START=969 /DNA_END=1152 /DNA_ORIENTATION=+